MHGRRPAAPNTPTSPPSPDINTERLFAEYRARTVPCHSCHAHFDGLGLSLEHYDTFGRFIDQREEGPVNASGFARLDGEDQEFSDVRGLASLLAKSPQVRGCVSGKMLEYALGTELSGACAARVEARVAARNGELSEIFRAIATNPLLRLRASPQKAP